MRIRGQLKRKANSYFNLTNDKVTYDVELQRNYSFVKSYTINKLKITQQCASSKKSFAI